MHSRISSTQIRSVENSWPLAKGFTSQCLWWSQGNIVWRGTLGVCPWIIVVLYVDTWRESMAVLNSGMSTKSDEELVFNQLQAPGKSLTIAEIRDILAQSHNGSEHRAKEVMWKLVEQGRAKFNKKWNLEAPETSS
jgi:hypothetical protein